LGIESAGFEGALISLSLIVAIGAQNAFVIRQGLSNRHVLLVCTICALSDAALIGLGVFGFGEFLSKSGNIAEIIEWLAISFLVIYSILRFRAAWKGNMLEIDDTDNAFSAKKTAMITMGFTWLNPHVYLDTMVLLGAISVQYNNISEKIIFAIFAMIASFVFFFSLGYGAKFLAPYFKSIKVWVFLDIAIAFIMYAIAYGLYKSL